MGGGGSIVFAEWNPLFASLLYLRLAVWYGSAVAPHKPENAMVTWRSLCCCLLVLSVSASAAPTTVFVSATADSENAGYEGANALDGNPATMWHTPWGGKGDEVAAHADRRSWRRVCSERVPLPAAAGRDERPASASTLCRYLRTARSGGSRLSKERFRTRRVPRRWRSPRPFGPGTSVSRRSRRSADDSGRRWRSWNCSRKVFSSGRVLCPGLAGTGEQRRQWPGSRKVRTHRRWAGPCSWLV